MTSFKLIGTSVLLGLAGTAAYGQRTLNAAGGTKVLAGKTYEWSVGEMAVVQTATKGTLTVTQGLLQPAAGPPNAVPSTVQAGRLNVYPNPATERVFIEHHFPQSGTLTSTLLDAAGKLVSQTTQELATGDGTQVLELHDRAAGTYLLQLRFTDRSRTESTAVYTLQKTQ